MNPACTASASVIASRWPSSTLASEVEEIRWLEVHPENYVERGGRFRQALDRARERWPFVTHGLTMGFGAVEPAEDSYVKPLRAFLHDLGCPGTASTCASPARTG